MATLWNSPLLTGDHVFLFDEDGIVSILRADRNPHIAMPGGKPIAQIEMPNSLYTNPAVEKGVLYVPTRNDFFAIEDPRKQNRIQKLLR